MSPTPLMQQYSTIKENHSDAILLYRMGDFYELFNEDAKIAAKILGLTLTARNHGGKDKTPLAGFPFHALDRYIPKLIKAGYKVAVCEQTEDPRFAKTIVKRDVTEIITAGTATDPSILEDKVNNYLVSIFKNETAAGLSFVDLSTGEFKVSEFSAEHLIHELERIHPAEILLPENAKTLPFLEHLKKSLGTQTYSFTEDTYFSYENAYHLLLQHFKIASLDGFGCEAMHYGISAAGAALKYLLDFKKNNLSHIRKLSPYHPRDYLLLDSTTQRSLELFESVMSDQEGHTLLNVLDRTLTPMGGRLLKNWMRHPLLNIDKINERLGAVEELIALSSQLQSLGSKLSQVYDIERLVARLGYEKMNARDMLSLRQSLEIIPSIKQVLAGVSSPLLQKLQNDLLVFPEITEKLCTALVENPPFTMTDGNLIKTGYSIDLDELKKNNLSAKQWIAQLQDTEREKTGISNLKIHYNKIYGYYIEISNSHKANVPAHYIRKQTLVNGERFITEAMKDQELKILSADEKIKNLEYDLFIQLRSWLTGFCEKIQSTSNQLAVLDVLQSFARCAQEYHYTKPVVDQESKIEITAGRHPVIEQIINREEFISNDVLLDNTTHQIHLITGPNMAGKSTFIRQVGLIVLMAQMGSFVPAKQARIGVVDRIFTRVGAADRLTRGQSTFLVEMIEMANILNNATPKSLLLLDEIGRGTSTFDGLSIAWAIIEYIHQTLQISAKTLFATHYHELTELEELLPKIKNYNVTVKESNEQIVFLRKIKSGASDKSYGIQVARLAGIPAAVIERAKTILDNLETSPESGVKLSPSKEKTSLNIPQTNLFEPYSHSQLETAVSNLDLDHLTPLQALNTLHQLKQLCQK